MNDQELWQFYWDISQFTRENYKLPPKEKLQKTKATGTDFISGLPANDLHCALLWHAIYKPFWNDRAANSGGPSWAWASLSQRVGWPDFSFSKRDEHVPCMQILGVMPAQPDTLETDDEESKRLAVVRRVKHYSTIVLGAELCTAAYALHTEKSWEATTLRKGFLTSLDLSRQMSCTMDADFSSREVWCAPVLKRKLSNGKWTTHLLVLEEVLNDVALSAQEHGDMVNEKLAGGSRTFRRVGTGKVSHEDRDLELMKTPEKTEIVLV